MSASFTVYVLQGNSNGKLYIGQTADLKRRLFEHGNRLSRYTKGRGPWKLIYQEEYHTRAKAMAREHFLKSGTGRDWFKTRLSLRESD